MSEQIYITSEFREQLQELKCGCLDDTIAITRKEGDKVFFQYGKCKLHVTKSELENIQLNKQT